MHLVYVFTMSSRVNAVRSRHDNIRSDESSATRVLKRAMPIPHLERHQPRPPADARRNAADDAFPATAMRLRAGVALLRRASCEQIFYQHYMYMAIFTYYFKAQIRVNFALTFVGTCNEM